MRRLAGDPVERARARARELTAWRHTERVCANVRCCAAFLPNTQTQRFCCLRCQQIVKARRRRWRLKGGE